MKTRQTKDIYQLNHCDYIYTMLSKIILLLHVHIIWPASYKQLKRYTLPYLHLELVESLGLVGRLSGVDLNNIESNSLRQWSALTNGNIVTLLNSETWRNVSSNILVSLFVPVVLWNVMQVVSSDDDSSVHLSRDNSTTEDSTSDRDQTGEWTLLVDVGSLNGGLRSLESQTNILVPSLSSLADLGLWVAVDVRLLENIFIDVSNVFQIPKLNMLSVMLH